MTSDWHWRWPRLAAHLNASNQDLQQTEGMYLAKLCQTMLSLTDIDAAVLGTGNARVEVGEGASQPLKHLEGQLGSQNGVEGGDAGTGVASPTT